MPKHSGHPSAGSKRPLASPRLMITFLAITMILLILAPIAVGFGAYFAFGHFEFFQGVQRVLVSISAGLLAMLLLNVGVMIPLAGFTAGVAQRLQTQLPPEEQELVTQLSAQHRSARQAYIAEVPSTDGPLIESQDHAPTTSTTPHDATPDTPDSSSDDDGPTRPPEQD